MLVGVPKEIKTKEGAAVLAKLGVEAGSKALVVLSPENEVVTKSLRNIPGIKVLNAAGLNVYDVLNAEQLILEDSIVEQVEARLS